MPLNWLDVTPLPFNVLLLLERVQLGWLPGWPPEKEMAIALHANPTVHWFLVNKNPEIWDWVEKICDEHSPSGDADIIRKAEETVMWALNDLLCYAVKPENYANQEFLSYADEVLLKVTDFKDKIVVDLGAGTGKLTFIAAKAGAAAVFAVEPVENLRRYILEEAEKLGLTNVYVMDGLITKIPFNDNFADVIMGGHVFGDFMEEEYTECARVAKPGGMVIYCPGSTIKQVKAHDFLAQKGFAHEQFTEPPELIVRKYWKTIEK